MGVSPVQKGKIFARAAFHKDQSETRRSDLPSSGHRQMANTLHLTMRDAIVALVLPFLTPARAACSTRAPRSSSTVSAAAPPALDFLLLDHVKVAAADADAHFLEGQSSTIPPRWP